MPGKFELFRNDDGKYRFRLRATNGYPVLASEGFSSRNSCEAAIASVQRNAVHENLFERRLADNGKPYFVLKAKDHRILGRSVIYDTQTAMENGILIVMHHGGTKQLEELGQQVSAPRETA